MPSREARSSLSADARTAIPSRVNRKNAPSPTITVATTIGITNALPCWITPPKFHLYRLSGVTKFCGETTSPVTHLGR